MKKNIFATVKKQQGVSLIMAIFIIVVLSMLGATMLSLQKGGSESVAREVLSTRALLAAQSGVQRQLSSIFPPGSSATVIANCSSGGSHYTLGGLIGCAAVDVDCQFVTVNSTHYFTITSTGRCGPVGEQAIRVVEVQAKGGN